MIVLTTHHHLLSPIPLALFYGCRIKEVLFSNISPDLQDLVIKTYFQEEISPHWTAFAGKQTLNKHITRRDEWHLLDKANPPPKNRRVFRHLAKPASYACI